MERKYVTLLSPILYIFENMLHFSLPFYIYFLFYIHFEIQNTIKFWNFYIVFLYFRNGLAFLVLVLFSKAIFIYYSRRGFMSTLSYFYLLSLSFLSLFGGLSFSPLSFFLFLYFSSFKLHSLSFFRDLALLYSSSSIWKFFIWRFISIFLDFFLGELEYWLK